MATEKKSVFIKYLEMPVKCKILEANKYPSFECALSKDKHIVQEPQVLQSCGHFTCKTCLPKIDSEPVKCRMCSHITERSLVSDENCDKIKNGIRSNIDSLLRVIERQMDDSVTMVSDVYNTNKDQINAKIEFIKEEIEIKIESIKIELDEVNKTFIEQLDNLRADLLNNEDEINSQVELSESVLNALRRDIESKTNQTEEKLYEYQNELRSLNELIEKLTSCSFDITFNESMLAISKEIIGTVDYSIKEPINDEQIIKKLKEDTFEEFHLNTEPNDICILPNGTLAICNSTQKTITIFDKDFNLLKTIDKIEDKSFHPLRITTDGKKHLYITEFSNYKVLMTDLNFKLIKSVGSKGKDVEQFDYPNGISFFERKLYICDSENKRLQVLSNDLEFEKAIELEYEPWIVKISAERVVCITQFDKAACYLYDFDTFTLKVKYTDHGFGRISEINSHFIESCKSNSKLYFYDKNGYFVEEIDAKRFACINSTADGVMVYYNRRILVTSSSEKKILRF